MLCAGSNGKLRAIDAGVEGIGNFPTLATGLAPIGNAGLPADNHAAMHSKNPVPSIVSIIIGQATRCRASGEISPELFDEQMRRLEREELAPKGLTLLVRNLSDNRTRFLIKERRTGTICDLLEFGPAGTPDIKPEQSHSMGMMQLAQEA